MADGAPVIPLIKGAARKLDDLDRSDLIKAAEQHRTASNVWLKHQIVVNNRIDILCREILGYKIKPFHLSMLQWQFDHPQSLQLSYRGAGKSWCCTIAKAIHFLCKNRNLRILLASESVGNAKGFLRVISGQLAQNKRLIEVFGKFYDPNIVSKWTDTEIEVVGKTEPTQEVSITCAGVDSAITSKHFDVLLSDDLVTRKNARSPRMRETVRQWYHETYTPMLMAPSDEIEHRGEHHHLGTRYHFNDLYGDLMEGSLKEHTQIIPAFDEHENVPWPEKDPPEHFRKLRREKGLIIFGAQFMCHSEDTEFLTENGWRLCDDVAHDERLATVNLQNGALEFQTALYRIKQPYVGTLLHMRNLKIDALLTANHQLVCKPADYPSKEDWGFVDVRYLSSKASGRTGKALLPSRVAWRGRSKKKFRIQHGWRKDRHGIGVWNEYSIVNHGTMDVDMDVFLRFLGFFIAEGSTSKKSRGGIRLSQNKGPILDSMRSTLREMGINFRECISKNAIALDFRHIGLWEWLRKNVKTSSENARIPRWCLSLSARQLRILFGALMDGDGYVRRQKKSVAYQYTSISKQLIDDISELAFKVGYDSSIGILKARTIAFANGTYTQRHDAWRICLRKAIGNGIEPEKQISKIQYHGNVVCFRVPNRTLVTRRNGRILISGNCDVEAMKGEIFQYDDCQELDDEDWPSETELKIFGGVDPAASEKKRKENAQFAIVIIGIKGSIRRDDYYVFFQDFFLDHTRPTRHGDKILEFYDRWDPIRMGIESNQYQATLRDAIKEKRPNCRVIKLQTMEDKLSRAWKYAGLFEDNRVFFRKGVHDRLIEQFILFPSRGKDIVDAFDLAMRAAKRRVKKQRSERKEFGVI